MKDPVTWYIKKSNHTCTTSRTRRRAPSAAVATTCCTIRSDCSVASSSFSTDAAGVHVAAGTPAACKIPREERERGNGDFRDIDVETTCACLACKTSAGRLCLRKRRGARDASLVGVLGEIAKERPSLLEI